MNARENLLALHYAKAFLNNQRDQLEKEDFDAMCKGYDFFKNHRQIAFLLRLSVVDQKTKYLMLEKIRKKMGLSSLFSRFLRVVVDRKHSPLFADIFNQLCKEYKRRHSIHFFSVSSSQELSCSQQEEVRNHLTRLVGGSIFCSYTVHSSLIAGIRLQSSTFLWESSIRQRLWAIHTSLLQR